MLTTPKIKDFVTRPTQKYEQMFNAIHHKEESTSSGTTNLEDLLKNENNMKEELKQYLKTHLKGDEEPESFDFSSASLF